MHLQLRFTQAETSLAPPDLTAFAAVDRRRSDQLLREQEADHDDSSALGDLIAASIVASRLRVIDDEPTRVAAPVFVPQRHWPIPAISTDIVTPAVDEFVLADHAYGHFAWPQRRPSRIGTALVLAACIPMFLPDTAAAQAAGARQPAATAVVPAAPAPAATPAPAPVVTTPPPMTAPVVETAPVATAPALPSIQSILYAMKGHEAVVFVAGRKVTGLIVGVDGDFVMMVDEDRDGKIAMIPKARITEIRGKTSVTRPRSREGVVLPPDGTGALAGGGVLVGIGGPLMISGLVFVGITPSYTPLWLPQVLPALLLLGGGIPLLVLGTRRRRAYQQAMFENRLARRVAPTFGRTPGGGWTGGLSLRF